MYITLECLGAEHDRQGQGMCQLLYEYEDSRFDHDGSISLTSTSMYG